MPNRQQDRPYHWTYLYLVERDGEHCILRDYDWGAGTPAQSGQLIQSGLSDHGSQLQIDHADGNEHNWKPENLHLICTLCNLKCRSLSPNQHRELISKYSPKNVCVREFPHDATTASKKMIDYTDASAEMQANLIYENKFLNWFIPFMNENKMISRKEARNTGAFRAGCSTSTIERYLDKLVCMDGPYMEVKEGNRTMIIPRYNR